MDHVGIWKYNFELSIRPSEGCCRYAIYGLGGCGKTALALETAYRTREQQPQRAVFWVPAIDQADFEQAYREI
ncbi:hypothetical protein GGP41_003107 [Bipolaris sorokiniana]|uniref:NB-ARC domain-containing protein n=1 Tax=Cochliobolus sativus TaxID=45130 RepID=A0A8H6DRW0_COCSA|nr:hypothetical protein GGP41_003107 [Bipolaris sorokiniana]